MILGGAALFLLLILALGIYWATADTSRSEASANPASLDMKNDQSWSLAPGTRKRSSTDSSASEKILELLSSSDPGMRAMAYNELFPAWVQRDPTGAAAFAQHEEAAPWRTELMAVAAQTWADSAPDDAEAWAAQLENPTESNMVLGYIALRVADTDARRAIQVLDNPRLNSDRQELLVENLSQKWSNQGLEPLAEWIDSFPPGKERDIYFSRLANSQAQSDPAEAARIVSTKMSAGPVQTDAVLNVLSQWTWTDLTSAVEWVNQFPQGKLRDRAWQTIAEVNARKQGVPNAPLSAREEAVGVSPSGEQSHR